MTIEIKVKGNLWKREDKYKWYFWNDNDDRWELTDDMTDACLLELGFEYGREVARQDLDRVELNLLQSEEVP